MTGKGFGFKDQDIRLSSPELKLRIDGRVNCVRYEEIQKSNRLTSSSYSYSISLFLLIDN